MSALPELVADGYDFEANGKKYHVSLITQQTKSDFEKACFASERNKLKEVRDLLTEPVYQEKASALADRYLEGGFSMVQDKETNPLNNAEYASILLALMLGISQVELFGLLSVKAVREELMTLFRLAVADSFPGLKETKEDTTAPTEAEKKG